MGPEQLAKPENGVHGRANLVGHVGQELAFRLVSRFRLSPGFLGCIARLAGFVFGPLALRVFSFELLAGGAFLLQHGFTEQLGLAFALLRAGGGDKGEAE